VNEGRRGTHVNELRGAVEFVAVDGRGIRGRRCLAILHDEQAERELLAHRYGRVVNPVGFTDALDKERPEMKGRSPIHDVKVKAGIPLAGREQQRLPSGAGDHRQPLEVGREVGSCVDRAALTLGDEDRVAAVLGDRQSIDRVLVVDRVVAPTLGIAALNRRRLVVPERKHARDVRCGHVDQRAIRMRRVDSVEPDAIATAIRDHRDVCPFGPMAGPQPDAIRDIDVVEPAEGLAAVALRTGQIRGEIDAGRRRRIVGRYMRRVRRTNRLPQPAAQVVHQQSGVLRRAHDQRSMGMLAVDPDGRVVRIGRARSFVVARQRVSRHDRRNHRGRLGTNRRRSESQQHHRQDEQRSIHNGLRVDAAESSGPVRRWHVCRVTLRHATSITSAF
jgi:hypothetical protein